MSKDNPKFHLNRREVNGALQEGLLRSQAFGKVTGLIIEKLKSNFSGTAGVKLFCDGGDPFVPKFSNEAKKEPKTNFEEQIIATVASEIGELFDSSGNILPERQQDYQRVLKLSPQIINIFTSKDYFIRLVQEDHILDLIRMGVQKSLNPEKKISLRVGFGGSDSAYTAERLVAYAVPALNAAQAIDKVFKKFANDKRNDAIRIATTRAYNAWEKAQGERTLEKDEKQAARRRFSQDEATLDSLTHEEREKLEQELQRYDPGTVTVECIFALHSAAAANGTNELEEKEKYPNLLYIPNIGPRTKANENAVMNFVATRYPDLADRFKILEDSPWNEFTFYQKQVLAYMEQILRESDDQTVVKTLKTLQKTGKNHGGEKNAFTYAALHTIFFGDDLALPKIEDFFGNHRNEPDYRVSFGGDPERHFNRIRTYLQEHVSANGFISYIEQQLNTARRDTENYQQLSDLLIITRDWQRENQNYPIRPSIGLIIPTRRVPYYPLEGIDRPMGQELSFAIIANRIAELEEAIRNLKKTSNGESGKERKLNQEAYEAVLADYRILASVLATYDQN